MDDKHASQHDASESWAAEAEQRLLDRVIRMAPVEGWTWRTVKLAGKAEGFSEGETELLAPHGPADLAALLSRRHDARAMTALAEVDPNSLKIRERIRRGLEARLDAAAADESATRRWAGYLTLPHHMALAGKLAWESADVLWRWAGDVATDENHYTKRALLGGILTGALAIRLSSGRAASLEFVDRRIADVMSFEKWKATTKLRPQAFATGLAQAFGRMRYGSTGR